MACLSPGLESELLWMVKSPCSLTPRISSQIWNISSHITMLVLPCIAWKLFSWAERLKQSGSQVVLFILSPLNTWFSLGSKHCCKGPFDCPGQSPLAWTHLECLPFWQQISSFPALVDSILQHPPFPLLYMPSYNTPLSWAHFAHLLLCLLWKQRKLPLGVLNMMIYCAD